MADHPSFTIPTNSDIKVWRYMDIAKYLGMLQQRALFFTRATMLGDPFEGSSTKPMVAAREYVLQHRATDPALARFKGIPAAAIDTGHIFKTLVNSYLVNCWHMNEHESAAMWNLYSKSNESVCIQSTYRKLRSCLPACVMIGEIKYIDYNVEMFPIDISFNFIVHKRKSFEHERELRAVFWEMDSSTEANGYKVKVQPAGLWVETDLSKLIEAVYVNPEAQPWLASVIAEVTAKYELPVRASQSALAESPLY
jgi:hypothetical protein